MKMLLSMRRQNKASIIIRFCTFKIHSSEWMKYLYPQLSGGEELKLNQLSNMYEYNKFN